MNIPLYVAAVDNGETVTLEQALVELELAQQAARESRAALEAELAKWGVGDQSVDTGGCPSPV